MFQKALKGLLAAGCKITMNDEKSGTIQAFRQMSGSLARPDFGHNLTVTVAKDTITITVAQAGTVVGGQSTEQVKNEVIQYIRNAK